jgi:hypothetical protein
MFFTPKGHALMIEVFEDINISDYEITEVDFADYTLLRRAVQLDRMEK